MAYVKIRLLQQSTENGSGELSCGCAYRLAGDVLGCGLGLLAGHLL